VFSAAGLKRPDLSIFSDEFLAEVKGLKHKNLAVDLLERLLKDEIKIRTKRNVVEGRSMSEMLQRTMNAYHNRAIATQEIIDELLKLAREVRDAHKRHENLRLSEDELCFYDVLARIIHEAEANHRQIGLGVIITRGRSNVRRSAVPTVGLRLSTVLVTEKRSGATRRTMTRRVELGAPQ